MTGLNFGGGSEFAAIRLWTSPPHGKIVTFGRRAAFTEAQLIDLDGKRYASATSSLIIL